MSKKNELNLKGPDAFQVKAAHSVEYIKANSKLVVAVVVLITISALAVIGSNYLTNQSVKERQNAVAEVDQIFGKEAKVASDKRGEIESKIDELKLADKDKPTPENKKKLQELEKSLEALPKADHSSSMTEYRQVYLKYENTPQGMLAGIRYASIAATAGNLQGAKDVLTKISRASKQHIILNLQANSLLISVLEDLKQYDEALSFIDEILKTAGDDLKPRFLLAKGRVLYLSKKFQDSKEALDLLINDYASAQEAEKARSLKALIN